MSNKCSCETTTEGNNNTECESNVLPNEITYVDPDYLKQLFMNLNQFRNDEKYCDFFFYMEDQRLCAHKVILSAASPFFNKRFRDGCICVENEGDGKDDDDTPSICDFDDDDDDDEDDDCFEDTCLDDPCLDDTCLDDVCLNDGKENPYRGSIEDEQSMFSCKCRVNVAKEEPRNQYNSEQPVFCSIPEQFAEPETTAHVNFSSSSTCDEQNPQRGFQNRKFTRSLISRYMDEVPLRPNKSFTFGAKELSTSDDYRCTKQETVNSQICVDNKIKYTPAKQMCKKISLISQYIDEAPSSINQNFFPKATNSIKKATECSPCYTSFSYNPKPEPRNAKDREDECNMNAPKDECRLRWTCQDSEKVPSYSYETKENGPERWTNKDVLNASLYCYEKKEEKENKDCEMQPLNCPQMRKRGKVPTKWPSRSVSSNDTKDEERGTNKRPSKPKCQCCTKEEEEKAGPIKPIRYDTNEAESARKWPSKPIICNDTKEQEIRVGNQPSRPACNCDEKKDDKGRVAKRAIKPVCCCDSKKGGQEGVRKWCSKPTFSSDTKEEDRTSRTSRTWTTETDTRQKETDEDDFRDPDSFCCEEDENRKQCADNSSMCPLNTKEDVGGRWTTRSGETLSTTSTEAKEETEEPKTLSSDFKDKSRRESSLKSTNGSANTPSKDSLTYSIHTEEAKENCSCKSFSICPVDQKEDAAITSETEEWPEKIVEVCTPTFPNKTGNMKQEVQERKSCKCPPTYSDNTKEQRPSKTMKVSGICADNIKEEAKHMNEEEQPLRINKSFVCLTDTTEECTGRWTCTTFTKISGGVKEEDRRWRDKEELEVPQMYSRFVEEKAIVSMTGAGKSMCYNSTKETSRGEWNEKESNGASSCPCETTISRPCVGVTNEVPIRKNTSFVCLPEVKEGTVKRWLWKGYTRDEVEIQSRVEAETFDTKGNFAERWVCKGPNRTYDGPKCLCDTRKIAGYTDTNEVPIRKNKSFVCVPEISEQGAQRWTLKKMNTSCSWASGAGRTQGGGGSQWLWPDNDVESKSSTTCKCSKCAPKPKLVPRPDDDRDDMFADSIRKGVKFGNVANMYSSCVKACIPCENNCSMQRNSVGKKDDNVVEKLRHVCDVVNSDMEESTNESMKFRRNPNACTLATGVPCLKKEDIKGRGGRSVQFEDIDLNTLKQIIDFIYTGKVTINEKNVRNLLLASSLLELDWITRKCFEFCKCRLTISNCFDIRSLANSYKQTDLSDTCDDYIYRNFLEVIDSEEYGLLCFEEVKDLLSSNEIVTDTEVSVFDGVINWIKHCPSERLSLLVPLMNCVRLPIMSAKCLMSCVANEPYIKNNPECKDLLLEAMKYHLVPEKRYLMISDRTQERKPSKMISHVILAGANCSEGRMYDKTFTNCVCMARMKQRRCQAGVTSWHNLLYVVGGKDQNNSLKTAECYNPLTNTWTNIPSMAAKHCNFGICSMFGLVYACGGHDGCSIHNYVECYDTLTSKWISCPAMKCSLDNTHASVLDKCIYCMGTIGGMTNFERFDLREGIWCKMPSLLNYRKYSDMVSYDNYLFCMGGLSLDNRAQNTGERFDVRANKWDHITPMPSPRYGHSMVEIDGNIYVIGGDHNLTVEYYNIGLNEWKQLESTSIKHSFGGAAVVNCFPLK